MYNKKNFFFIESEKEHKIRASNLLKRLKLIDSKNSSQNLLPTVNGSSEDLAKI